MTLLAPAAPARALLGLGPADVESLLPWEDAEWSSLFASGPAEPLRERLAAYDLALAYSTSAELARNLSACIRRVVAQDPAPSGGHASSWLARPLAELGLDAGAEPPPCQPTAAERAECAALDLRLPPGFLAVHPGSGSPRKNWPPQRFAELAERVSPNRPWLLVEGPADADAAAPLARSRCARRVSALPARTLGALLAQAGAYVGNDSGVSHLAAAWGAPTLTLFGPTDPAVWAPLGPCARALRSPDSRMEGIAVDAAVEALGGLATCSAPGRPSG